MFITPDEVQEKINGYYESEAAKRNEGTLSPQNPFRASSLGYCTRRLYYSDTEPELGTETFSPELMQVFRFGDMHEQGLIQLLQTFGYTITHQQYNISRSQFCQDAGISGHIDLIITDPITGNDIPAEVKSVNTFDFKKISSIEDFSKSVYLQRYLTQAQIYVHALSDIKGNDYPYILFILIDKEGWSLPKVLAYPKDNQKMLEIVNKVNLLKHSIATKTPPERQPYGKECQSCPFSGSCLPDLNFEGPITIEDPNILDLIKLKFELDQQAKGAKNATETLREYFRAKTLGSEGIFIADDVTLVVKKGAKISISYKKIGSDSDEE